MAIQKELWVAYIMGNLFKDNEVLNSVFREDDFVINGAVVHIPQAGSKPTVTKNRSSFPATVVTRTDTDITYALDAYSTPPTKIPNIERYELSYDKQDSVLGEHVDALQETITDDLLIKWAPALTANILRTTGDAVAAHMPSATGNRKTFVKEDLKRAQARLNKLNISKKNRFAVMSTDMHSQLLDDADLKVRDFGGELNMRDGHIDMLYGFKVLERSDVVVYDNATPPAVKALGAAGAAADNDAVICFEKNSLAMALGKVDFFEDLSNPLYYGDIYSAEVRCGGRKRRTNEEGVVAIVQAASA